MEVEIKEATTDKDIKKVNQLAQYGFDSSPSEEQLERRLERAKFRTETVQYLLQKNDEAVATAAIHPMKQNIRGKLMKMGGVATIATAPEGRRKGYVRKLMQLLFERMYKDGQSVSCLMPFRESFYGNFGYTNLPQWTYIEIKPDQIATLLDKNLEFEFNRFSFKDGKDIFFELLEKTIKKNHGMVSFTNNKFGEKGYKEKWIVIVKHQSKVVGGMIYSSTGFKGKLKISDFIYLNSGGKYGLLYWIALHIDQITKAKFMINPGGRIEYWLEDVNSKRSSSLSPMGRIVNLHELSGIKVNEGEITLGIEDEYCPWNTGTWRFTGVDGKLEISTVEQEPELSLDIKAISAIIYGAYNLNDFPILGYGNIDNDLKKRIRRIFPHKIPFINEKY